MQKNGSELHAVAVVGSPRARGNTSLLVDEVLDELERHGVRCDKILLGERRVAACLGHENCSELAVCAHRDDGPDVLDLAFSADCLILATPVYYENVTALMKAFMDRSYFPYVHGRWLEARVCGLVAVTAESGLDDTLAALRRYVALSTEGDVPVFSVGGYASDPGEVAEKPELLAAARRLGADLAAALK